MYVSLRIGDSLIGFMIVYVPTEALARSRFWSRIKDVLPSVDSWIIGGDFNNVEAFEDWRAEISPSSLFYFALGTG